MSIRGAAVRRAAVVLSAAAQACAPADGAAADGLEARLLGSWARVDAETVTDASAVDRSRCALERRVQLELTLLAQTRRGDLVFEQDDDGDLWAASGGAGETGTMRISEARLRLRGEGGRLEAWGLAYDLTLDATSDTLSVAWTGGDEANLYRRCPPADAP